MEGILNQGVCGGVERIVLLPIGELSLILSSGGWAVEPTSSAVEVRVEEGSAQCREERVVRDGVSRVSHLLEVVIEEDHPALQLLAEAEEGVGAVVCLYSGESRLLGYSSDFAKEYASSIKSTPPNASKTLLRVFSAVCPTYPATSPERSVSTK